MANKKKEYYKPGPMTEGKRNIIQGLLQKYNIQSAADIQEALKDLLGRTIKEMMEAEMDEHLGYEKSERQTMTIHGIHELLIILHNCHPFMHLFNFCFIFFKFPVFY